MSDSILLNHPLFKEIDDRCKQGDFIDAKKDITGKEKKICDMSDLLKGVQSLMVEKQLATNEALLAFDKLNFGDQGFDDAAALHNRLGSEAMILTSLRNFLHQREATEAGYNILDKKIHIRAGFIITVEPIDPGSN